RGTDGSTPRHVDAVRINRVATSGRKIDTINPSRIRPDGAGHAVVFRQTGNGELDFRRSTGIGNSTEILAIRQARPETTTFKAADQLRAGREGFNRMHAIAAEVIDDTGLAADAGNDTAVLDHRDIVAGTCFAADQAVIPADILL